MVAIVTVSWRDENGRRTFHYDEVPASASRPASAFSGVRAGIRIRLHGAFEKTKVRTTNVFLTLLHGTTRALHCKVVIFEKRPVEDKYLRRIALTAVQTHRHTSTLCVNDSRHSVTSRLC